MQLMENCFVKKQTKNKKYLAAKPVDDVFVSSINMINNNFDNDQY